MNSDRLSAEERLDTAMRYGVPDRVPVAPLIHYFAAACAGMSCADLWWNRRKYRYAMKNCFDMVGPWDASYLLDAVSPEAYTWLVPMKMRVPGRDLPDDSPAQLDSATDIFRARKILGNRIALLGDVSPMVLCHGAPEEVDAYCRRLIEEVGGDGAFTLGAGCEIPYDARVENVRAMIGSVKKYGYY